MQTLNGRTIRFLFISLFFITVSSWAGTTATGKKGMVATAHPLASKAGLSILKQGGNAVDAAVAAAFTIGVVEPDGSGLGGGGGMVIYLQDKKDARYINYYQQTGERAAEVKYAGDADRHTARSILVPGTVAGLTLALEKFGSLPLSTVMQPAIDAAENGFEIDATLARIILDNVEVLQSHPQTSATYLDEGFPRMEGDSLFQPQLAQTLRRIAQKGRAGFYQGPVAQKIVDGIQAGGGLLTLDDFSSYEAELTQPAVGSYRGYQVLSAQVPQSGTTIIEALNMLELVPLSQWGHYSTSAKTLHLMAETFKRTYADRWRYVGDPRFNRIPTAVLLDKGYAKERFNSIDMERAKPQKNRKTKAGNPLKYETGALDRLDEAAFYANLAATVGHETGYDGGHTTHLSVIDKDGNAVALTQTLGTFFGSGQTYAGVLMNCAMSNFSRTAKVNQVRPRMRPRSSISPTVVLKDDKPFLVVGSPGAGRIISTVVELIVNAIDFNMSAEEMNDAPRFYCQKWDDYLHLEYGISDAVAAKLSEMGHTIQKYPTRDLFFGGAQVILINTQTGLYEGSADKRRGGVAFGY